MCVCVCVCRCLPASVVSCRMCSGQTWRIPLTLKLSSHVSREDDPSVTLLITMHRACSSACSALSSWTQMVIRVVEIGFYFIFFFPLCILYLLQTRLSPFNILHRLEQRPPGLSAWLLFMGQSSAVWCKCAFEFQMRLPWICAYAAMMYTIYMECVWQRNNEKRIQCERSAGALNSHPNLVNTKPI